MKKPIEISVILATYNRVTSLKHQLLCLINQTWDRDRYEIIIVDDGSTDDTAIELKALAEKYPVIHYFHQQNRGPAAARNLGASQARGSIIAFTDDDCIADQDWLKNIDAIFHDEEVVAIQGKTVSDRNLITPLTHQVINEEGDSSIPTCNAAYRKEVFVEAGGFDEGFVFAYNEDADLAWRVREIGKVVFAPEVLMVHPPRPDSFMKNVRRMRYFVTEFKLFHKNPALYQKYRYSSPWKTIYGRIMFKSQGIYFLQRLKFIDRPKLLIQGIALSICWWADLILKIPAFWQADEQYKNFYRQKNQKSHAITELQSSSEIKEETMVK